MILNNTNQTVTLRKGCPVARLSRAEGSIDAITVSDRSTHRANKEELEQVEVPEEFKTEVDKLLRKIATSS